MNTVEKRLLKLADNAYQEKVKIEKKNIEERYGKDKEILTQVLEIIKNRLVYKEVGDNWNKKFVVVTEEMLFEDYTTPKNSYSRGTKIENNRYGLIISVNGHTYSHVGQLIANYKEQVKKSIEMNQWEREKLEEKKRNIENLEKQELTVKKIVEDFNELKAKVPDSIDF